MSPEEIYEHMEPIEGLRVELLGGRLVMTGGASIRHDDVIWQLVRALFGIADDRGWRLLENRTIHIQATRDRPKPDLVVAPSDAPSYDDNELYAHGVLLAAEVASPGSKHDDREAKAEYYAQGDVPLYMLIDIEAGEPAVALFSDPVSGTYRSVVTVLLGEQLPLPEPFGMILDTGSLQVG
jgi:Uma2 family endonuclease